MLMLLKTLLGRKRRKPDSFWQFTLAFVWLTDKSSDAKISLFFSVLHLHIKAHHGTLLITLPLFQLGWMYACRLSVQIPNWFAGTA